MNTTTASRTMQGKANTGLQNNKKIGNNEFTWLHITEQEVAHINKERENRIARGNKVIREFINRLARAEQKQSLPKYYTALIKHESFLTTLCNEYEDTQSLDKLGTLRTLHAVELLEDNFKQDYSDPERTAQAILKLLEPLPLCIKEIVRTEIAKNNHHSKSTASTTDYKSTKARLNLELLLA